MEIYERLKKIGNKVKYVGKKAAMPTLKTLLAISLAAGLAKTVRAEEQKSILNFGGKVEQQVTLKEHGDYAEQTQLKFQLDGKKIGFINYTDTDKIDGPLDVGLKTYFGNKPNCLIKSDNLNGFLELYGTNGPGSDKAFGASADMLLRERVILGFTKEKQEANEKGRHLEFGYAGLIFPNNLNVRVGGGVDTEEGLETNLFAIGSHLDLPNKKDTIAGGLTLRDAKNGADSYKLTAGWCHHGKEKGKTLGFRLIETVKGNKDKNPTCYSTDLIIGQHNTMSKYSLFWVGDLRDGAHDPGFVPNYFDGESTRLHERTTHSRQSIAGHLNHSYNAEKDLHNLLGEVVYNFGTFGEKQMKPWILAGLKVNDLMGDKTLTYKAGTGVDIRKNVKLETGIEYNKDTKDTTGKIGVRIAF